MLCGPSPEECVSQGLYKKAALEFFEGFHAEKSLTMRAVWQKRKQATANFDVLDQLLALPPLPAVQHWSLKDLGEAMADAVRRQREDIDLTEALTVLKRTNVSETASAPMPATVIGQRTSSFSACSGSATSKGCGEHSSPSSADASSSSVVNPAERPAKSKLQIAFSGGASIPTTPPRRPDKDTAAFVSNTPKAAVQKEQPPSRTHAKDILIVHTSLTNQKIVSKKVQEVMDTVDLAEVPGAKEFAAWWADNLHQKREHTKKGDVEKNIAEQLIQLRDMQPRTRGDWFCEAIRHMREKGTRCPRLLVGHIKLKV